MKIDTENIVKILKGDIAALSDISEDEYDIDLSDIGVDSLDRNTIFLDLEENFEMEFTDEDIDKLNTVNKIIAFIKNYPR